MSCVFDNTATGYRLVLMDETGTNRATAANTIVSGEVISFTVPNDLADKPFLGYMLRKPGGSTSDFTNLIITMNEPNMAYEIYQSHSYLANLGTIELAKISDYQDYIYKSGDDWYVHKMMGKYTFTGSEPIAYNSNGGFILCAVDLPTTIVNMNIPPLRGFCDRFIVNTTTTTWTGEGRIGLSSNSTFWCQSSVLGTTQQSCKQWLTDNTPTLYYTLATPTDTKITDSTLISQLDAIHQFLTRYGYNATVSGNLPMIIDKTNL